MQKFTILGRLDGLNEYINANRSNPYKGAKMKSDNEKVVMFYAKCDQVQPIKNYPIKIKIDWYEKDNRRDWDNIVSAKKFLFDGLIKAKILKDDGRKYINDVKEDVYIDRENPRVEVFLIEE